MDSVIQIPGEPFRRWFWDPQFDLVVWYDDAHAILGFQLCYDKGPAEHALTWILGRGFIHTAVSADGSAAGRPHSGFLTQQDRFPRDRVLEQFQTHAGALPPEVASFVCRALKAYPYEFSPSLAFKEAMPLKQWADQLSHQPVRIGRRVFPSQPS